MPRPYRFLPRWRVLRAVPRFFFLFLIGLLWPASLMQQTGAVAPLVGKPDSLRLASLAAGDWSAYRKRSVALADQCYEQDDFESAKAMLHETLQVLTAHQQGDRLEAARVWGWLAFVCREQEHYVAALEAYRQAIRRYEGQHYRGELLTYCYKNAAQVCMRWNNYRLANDYLQAGLRSDTAGTYRLSIYAQLANNYYWQDSLAAAWHYFELGRRLPEDEDGYAAASLWGVGSALMVKTGNLNAARALEKQALSYYQSQTDEEENRLRARTALADIAARQGRRVEAGNWFRQAEAFGKTSFPGKSREMAILYLAWGDFYEQTGALDQALTYYQKAIIQVFPGFDDPDPTTNPSLSEAYIESQAMFALACKGAALLKKSAPTPTERANAADCFELSFAVAAKLRQAYGNDADKLTLAGDNRAYQRLAVLNLWQLWQPGKDAYTLTRLFRLLEQTKAQALADAMRQQRALALGGIPDSLLAREQTLRLTAADAGRVLKITALRGAPGDSLKIVHQQEQAFRSQRLYADFLNDLGKQYHSFQQFTTEFLPADPAALQAALPDSAALLSWFDAGDRYLCMVTRRAGLAAYEVPRDSSFNRRLSGFLLRLTDKTAQENAPGEYFTEAFALGQQLLPAEVTAGLHHLIMVPDGPLCYLPFEALLTAPHAGNFATAPYLLRSHTVQYAWSATLLTMAADTRLTGNQKFLHLVPFAKAARDGLVLLPNSPQDKPDQLPATVLAGEEASVAGFLQRAPDYGVLHLSTHASAGGSGQPGIEFYDRTLTLPEVYAQRLRASLVSLSACETGAGRFAEGEGILSLARAFAYAGAQSLVASHWSANERSTAELFSVFYENLQKGLTKSEALRQAKLAYLAAPEMDARKAPYQWAAFTLTGMDGQVEFGESRWRRWSLWAGGLGLSALVIWSFRKRRRM